MTKERPILFSGAMVRAILDGRKRQTRRVAKEFDGLDVDKVLARFPRQRGCPYGEPGDRLWVRETWAPDQCRADVFDPEPDRLAYAADFVGEPMRRWRPSIHMPRTACRLVLEITEVRVERLNDCSEADAEAEGIAFLREVPDVDETLTARQLYECLWDSINGARAWEKNPWVWVVEFRLATNEHREKPVFRPYKE